MHSDLKRNIHENIEFAINFATHNVMQWDVTFIGHFQLKHTQIQTNFISTVFYKKKTYVIILKSK